MRVIVMIKATANSEAGKMPDEKLLTAMGAYNEALAKAGIMQSGEGLQASSQAKRVRFEEGLRNVSDGPFELGEGLVAGFWMWKVKSMDEALEWVMRCPDPMPGEVADFEIRPVFEAEDFGQEFTPELRAKEEKLRARLEKQQKKAKKAAKPKKEKKGKKSKKKKR
jgi:hypothetical protein